MLRFDDQFPLHRKVDGLTDSAFRMHVEAIFWSARNLTDGFITQDDLTSACRYRKPEGYLTQVVKRGAWHRIADGQITDCAQCADRYGNTLTGDGWLIHGYLDWQLPRSKVLQIRLARQKAGKLGGKKSGEVRAGFASGKSGGLLRGKQSNKTPVIADVEAPAKQTAKQRGSTMDEPPIPSPSKEGNRGSPPASRGGAGPPSKPTPLATAVPNTPNGEVLDSDTARALARKAATPKRRPSLPDPFQPPQRQDKAQAALTALADAIAKQSSPQSSPQEESDA